MSIIVESEVDPDEGGLEVEEIAEDEEDDGLGDVDYYQRAIDAEIDFAHWNRGD